MPLVPWPGDRFSRPRPIPPYGPLGLHCPVARRDARGKFILKPVWRALEMN